ncbi:MAG: shikimate dehydrogenase [Sphingomonas sp.]|nr:shikimate dehydrogenase [Sphingomonas sp.]
MTPYAEVIGDPVAQSRSPAIHGGWLAEAGIEADYKATRVTCEEVEDFLAGRRSDPAWRGCNVTAPLKQAVIPHLDRLDPAATKIGAVNCIVPEADGLTGYNTDVDGVTTALDGADLAGASVAMIGAGGAARAGLAALAQLGAADIRLLARTPERAEPLRAVAPFAAFGFDQAPQAMAGVMGIVNASSLGMAHIGPMPPALLDALPCALPSAIAFDMVYNPPETAFLTAARAHGLRPVGGFVMLEGQARRAFRLFFGDLAPARRSV